MAQEPAPASTPGRRFTADDIEPAPGVQADAAALEKAKADTAAALNDLIDSLTPTRGCMSFRLNDKRSSCRLWRACSMAPFGCYSFKQASRWVMSLLRERAPDIAADIMRIPARFGHRFRYCPDRIPEDIGQ